MDKKMDKNHGNFRVFRNHGGNMHKNMDKNAHFLGPFYNHGENMGQIYAQLQSWENGQK